MENFLSCTVMYLLVATTAHHFVIYFHISGNAFTSLKLDLYDKKQLANTLKIRILPKTSILYLIRYASIILIVGLHLQRRMPTSNHCWRKIVAYSGLGTSIVQHSRSSFRCSIICDITPIRKYWN